MLAKKSPAPERREEEKYTTRVRRDRPDEDDERVVERKRRFEEREEERGRRDRDTSSVGEREDFDSRNKRVKRTPEREKSPAR